MDLLLLTPTYSYLLLLTPLTGMDLLLTTYYLLLTTYSSHRDGLGGVPTDSPAAAQVAGSQQPMTAAQLAAAQEEAEAVRGRVRELQQRQAAGDLTEEEKKELAMSEARLQGLAQEVKQVSP